MRLGFTKFNRIAMKFRLVSVLPVLISSPIRNCRLQMPGVAVMATMAPVGAMETRDTRSQANRWDTEAGIRRRMR